MDSRSKNSYDDETKSSGSKKKVPGLLSRVLFLWIFPLFHAGYIRDLHESDLVPPKKSFSSKLVADKLESKWFQEEAAARAEGRDPSFTRAVIKAFWWHFIPGGIMQFGAVALRSASPLLFSQLLNYWSKEPTMTRETTIYYAVGMIACNVLGAVLFHHGVLHCQQFGMLLRIATSSLMFRKIMRMDSCSLGDTKAGKVVNILSNDLQRFDVSFTYLHSVWIIPFQIVFALYVGYLQAGVAAIIGIVVLLLTTLPVQAILAKLVGKARYLTTQKTDARVKLMNEVISGIQVIKMYAWEKPFEKLVQEKRKSELLEVRQATIFRTLMLGFVIFNERLAIFISALVYTLLGNHLTASVIYPLQQLLITMRVNLTLLMPMLLSFMAEMIITINRVQEFMNLKERPDIVKMQKFLSPLTKINFPKEINDESTLQELSYKKKPFYINNDFQPDEKYDKITSKNYDAVELQNVSASWTRDPKTLTLKDISICIPKGKVSAIIGPVGAGKSSLLELILKELTVHSGKVAVRGEVSYACQDVWLFTNTVRENIIFGLPFEENKYKKVCQACALDKDFQQLPYGEQTLVGERGVLISGGQRARINLARAVYREADIYLLDDPLSAVDSNVGRQLFEDCIKEYLRGRTRILVNHQVHFLKDADFIIVLNEGKLEASGTFEDIVLLDKNVTSMLASLAEQRNEDEEDYKSTLKINGKQGQLRVSAHSQDMELTQFKAQKMEAEKRASGNLSWRVLTEYFSIGSHWSFVAFTFTLIFISAGTAAASDYWMSYWINHVAEYEQQTGEFKEEIGIHIKVGKLSTTQYLTIYGVIVAVGILIINVRVIPFVKMCLSTSNKLHKKMLSTMLRATMRFFDANSSGRILNRFVKDVGAIDDSLPRALMDLLQVASNVSFVLILNVIALYWTIVPSSLLAFLSYVSIKIYLRGAQGIKRLESTCISPVFDMVNSTLRGITTVRAGGAQERLIDEFDNHLDLHTRSWNAIICGGSGFGAFLDMACLLYLTVILFTFLFVDLGGSGVVGDIGLALTQATMLVTMLQYGVRAVAEFIAQLTSVERMLEYTQIQMEDNIFAGHISTPQQWPGQGNIEFENVTMRYSTNDAPVLKNLNLKIESGSKIGIVGRTGAGKSSLISAIFRFACIEGKIMIDNVDTSLLSKQDLRQKISIIPQEPVLFSATIRSNLDPFDDYSDDKIWKSLEQVDMKSAVPSLDYKVTEGGTNFSVGQRQLMCLARAVLRSNKILIMDEATANVDPQTDNFIQQTIRRQFASCTVLTIAHRLNTIMDSDRVLLMDGGEVAEYDHPYILLSNPNSKFSSLVRETADKSYDQLYNIAKDRYFLTVTKQQDHALT